MTKKQHYVPQFYLKNFINKNKKLDVYDRKRECFLETAPKEICFENYLHETLWEDANPRLGKYVLPNQIESKLALQEGKYSTTLKKIINTCIDPSNRHSLICNRCDKETLTKFVANMIVRNPWVLHKADADCFSDGIMDIDEIQVIDQLLTGMRFGGTKSLVKAANKMVWLDEEFIPSRICEELRQMPFCFFLSTDNSFITSNFPVLYEIHSSEEDITCLDNIYIPIHPQIALLYSKADKFRPFKNKIALMPAESVRLMNSCFFKLKVEQARFIIASNKMILEELRTT